MANNNKKHRLAVIIEPDMSSADEDSVVQAEDEVDFVRLRRKKITPITGTDQRSSIRIGQRVRHSVAYIQKRFRPVSQTVITLSNGILSFITIKVFLWDLIISVADVVTDFIQGYTLYNTPGTEVYGLVSLGINWLPGLAASIHLVSMYRTNIAWHRVILYAFLLLIFYPVVPFCAFVYLLYKKPKSASMPVTEEFKQAEYLTTMAYAISGGLESPIQLIYQVWLVLNGVISLEWSKISTISFTDWEGNHIYLPFTSSLCITFSVISILKAVLEFNVTRVHIKSITDWKKLWTSIPTYFDHFPYLASTAFFRIASVIAIMTYLNAFGFIPIIVVWICNVVINQITLRDAMDHIPNWLIIFMSVFVPVCFTSKMFKTAKDQQEMIKIQYKTFKLQTLASFISYTITLIVVLVYVNSPCTFPDFRYNQEIILSNQEFNVYGVGILVMGSLSLLLSMTPKCSMMLCCCQIKYDPAQVNNNAIQKINEKDTFGTMFKVLWSLLIMAIVVTPVILPPLILNRSLSTYIDPSYIFFKPSINETRIIQATTIEPFKGTLEGYLKYFMSTNDPSESRNTGTNKTGIGINRKFPDLNTDKDVIVISRKHWDERKDQILLTNPLGIIIIDNQVLRPSSPLPTFQNQDLIGPPIVLVRQEDGHHFTEDLDGGQFLMQIWMTSKAWMVYDPDWLCDTLYSCLSANFKEGFISGRQYRTKTCHWGGHSCPETNSTQQFAPYCNGPGIKVCPLDASQGFGSYEDRQIRNEKRTLRSSPPVCMAVNSFNVLINECDRGVADWTFWLGWEIQNQDKLVITRSRRRYCLASQNDCLFEEKFEEQCCKDPLHTDCDEFHPCFYAPLIPN